MSIFFLTYGFFSNNMMESEKNLKNVIENAYNWLDYDKDGLVSLKDIQAACQIQSLEEARQLIRSIKNNPNDPSDFLSFADLYSGILECPEFLSKFSHAMDNSNE